ncbi:carcinine transporter-like [Tachypleus tridentatus]|uniref:carcinine transporter-like n=1 Tax=Tachypleus tridentatus TaxID=6853 RepID=UPI003FD41033
MRHSEPALVCSQHSGSLTKLPVQVLTSKLQPDCTVSRCQNNSLAGHLSQGVLRADDSLPKSIDDVWTHRRIVPLSLGLAILQHLNRPSHLVLCQMTPDYFGTQDEWDLVCDNNHLPSLIFTLALAGAVATPIYGTMSDRIGRKLTFFICVMITFVSGVISLVLPNFTAFALFRFINGSLLPTIFQVPYIMLVEIVGKEKRTRLMGIACIGWTLGLCSLPLFAFLFRNWRTFGLITTCFCIPYFFYWRFLPESTRWLVSVGRYEEAVVILTEMAKTNGRPLPIDLVKRLTAAEEAMKKEKIVETTHDITDFFCYRTLRKRFLIVTVSWAANSMVYYGLQINATNLYGNEFLNFFLFGLVELPSYFLCWYLMERIGRRWTNVSLMLLGALSILIPTILLSELALGTTIGTLVGKFGCSAAFMVVYQQSAELYPTPIRALGMGASATVACIATICTPYIIYLGTYEKHIPYFIIGGICLIASFAASFLPETLNAKLPQTIEDGEKFGNNQKYFSCFGSQIPEDDDTEEKRKLILVVRWNCCRQCNVI